MITSVLISKSERERDRQIDTQMNQRETDKQTETDRQRQNGRQI